MFLCLNLIELDNYIIFSELWYSSNYAPLVTNISIVEEFIQDKHCIIIKNSEEEENFIIEFISSIGSIDTTNISDKTALKYIVQEYSIQTQRL